MKNRFTTFCFVTLFAASSFAAEAVDKVVAKYENVQVKASEVFNKFSPELQQDPNYKDKSFDQLPSEMQAELTKHYINALLVQNEISKRKITESQDFKLELDRFKETLGAQLLLKQVLADKVTEKVLAEKVSQVKAEFAGKSEAKAKAIRFDSQEQAKEVRKQILKGEKFEAIAKKLSQKNDPKAQVIEPGGYILEGKGSFPELESKIFSMAKDEVSSPIQTNLGWYIVKLVDKRKVALPDEASLKRIASARLEPQVIQDFVQDLNKAAKVEILLPKASSDSAEPSKSPAKAQQ